jgi:hypothetical protein
MVQESLLLRFRERQNPKKNEESISNYNVLKGYWQNDDGSAILDKYMLQNLSTTKTATRESTDRSELSVWP